MITENKKVRKTAVDVAEITTVATVADVATSLSGTYFTLNGIDTNGDTQNYYVWIDVNNGSDDPAPAGLTGIEVDISEDDTAATVATAVAAAIDANANFGAAAVDDDVTITAAFKGPVVNAADVDTGFTIAVSTEGSSTSVGGECELVRIIVSNAGTGDLYIRDNTTVLAKADLTQANLPTSIEFGIPITTTLHIILTVAADILIVYRT